MGVEWLKVEGLAVEGLGVEWLTLKGLGEDIAKDIAEGLVCEGAVRVECTGINSKVDLELAVVHCRDGTSDTLQDRTGMSRL